MPSRTASRGLTAKDLARTRRTPPTPVRTHKLDAADTRKAANVLEKVSYASIDRRQNERHHYGRTLDLDVIDTALQRAARGEMLAITDLGNETLRLDGHLSGIVNKRLNRSGAINWSVVANDGSGRKEYDHGRAKDRADFVRAQLLQIPNFRESLRDISWSTWNNRSCSEIEWSITSGAEAGDSKLYVGWRPKGVHWVHPRRLSFSQQRKVVITDDYDPGYGFKPKGFPVDQLPEKFIVSTPRMFNDYPELEGLIMRAQYWSFFQRLGTRERIILLELFGTPWRVAYSKPNADGVGPSDDTIREAFTVLQNMSGRNAAWLPAGVEPYFYSPQAGAGQTHKEMIDDARYVLSKLVLGVTSTTDAVPTGLGSSIAETQLSEEDLIIAGDLYQRAEVIEHQLTDRIIELNYGPEELIYAPRFQFDIKGQTDRQKEVLRLDGTLKLGVAVALEEVYEVTGYRQPRPGEPVLMMVEGDPSVPGSSPRPKVVYAPKKAPAPGELAIEPAEAIDISGEEEVAGLVLTPSALESFVKINEARQSQHLPPLTLPDGSPDPDGDLTIAAYKAKQEAKQAGIGENQADQLVPPAPKPAAPPALPPKPGAPPPADAEVPDDEEPDEEVPEERVAAADKDEIIIPYTSPSGLSDADRELLSGKTAKAKRAKGKNPGVRRRKR